MRKKWNEKETDDWNAMDFIWFFRSKAKERGIDVEAINFGRDGGLSKKMLKDFSKEQLRWMINKFLSDERYVGKLSPPIRFGVIWGWRSPLSKEYENMKKHGMIMNEKGGKEDEF